MKNKLLESGELVKLIFNVSPVYFAILLLNAVVGSIQVYINLLVSKVVIDQLISTNNIMKCLYLVIIIVATNAFLLLINNIMKYVLNNKTPLIREKMKKLMAEKIMNSPYYKLEDSHYLDLKERAMFAINEQGAIFNIVYNFAELIKNIAIVISIIGMVFSFTVIFVLFLLFIMVFMFLLYIKYLNYQKEFYDNLLILNRRETLFRDMAYDKKYSMDFRLYGIKKLLLRRYSKFLDNCCELMDDFNNNKGKYLATFSILDNFIKIMAYGYVGVKRFTNLFGEIISIGSCVMYVNAVSNFSLRISKISENLVQIKQMLKYLEPYLEFMKFKDEKYEGTFKLVEPIKEIRFDKVSFKYPGAKDFALTDISFVIKQGDMVALAGKNGSGKTTIIKLICKLYTPTYGTIYVNGIDIAYFDTESYLEAISAIFQDFKIFNYSIVKNISFYDKADKKIRELVGKLKLNKVLDKLPNGIESIIGKEYDLNGVELSGGEYQKIAIARAAYKEASLYIMDEPTSALDPIVEVETFEDMKSIIKDKTSIFVSHRMASCKICSNILVFEKGRLMEWGNHNELFQKAGIYWNLYSIQAKKFTYKNFNE